MKVIWKFTLELEGYQDVEMPAGAEVLHVAAQDNTPCVWALVDPKALRVPRRFLLCVTGTSPNGEGKHVGTFLLYGGAFVGHVFDCGAVA